MPTRPQITLTKEELERAEIPTNHVLIEMQYKSEDLKTHTGIQIGFNSEVLYSEGDTSHIADVAEIWGIVKKIPHVLFFDPDDPKSMDWECNQELMVGDIVFFNVLESKNANEVKCDGKIYRSVPYADVYCIKRNGAVIVVNGFCLCTPVYHKKLSSLDVVSENNLDKTRGVIAYIGNPVKRYLRPEYCHLDNLKVGDEVLFSDKTPLFYLERLKETAVLDGNLYWVVARRRIAMILK
jgi:hypothetical protein